MGLLLHRTYVSINNRLVLYFLKLRRDPVAQWIRHSGFYPFRMKHSEGLEVRILPGSLLLSDLILYPNGGLWGGQKESIS